MAGLRSKEPYRSMRRVFFLGYTNDPTESVVFQEIELPERRVFKLILRVRMEHVASIPTSPRPLPCWTAITRPPAWAWLPLRAHLLPPVPPRRARNPILHPFPLPPHRISPCPRS